MRRRAQAFLIVVFCLFMSSVALAEEGHFSAQAYLEDLHSQGKERVIIVFKDEVDPTLVEKYNGKLIRTFTTIKALLCELPQENIEPLKQEAAVEEVAPDMIMEIQTGDSMRDPEELAEERRLKREYLKKIRKEYLTAIQEARQEYITFIRKELPKRRRILIFYGQFIRHLKNRNRPSQRSYRYFLSRYHKLLREYYQALREARQEYYNAIILARNVYLQLAGGWREEVREMMALSYDGTVTVRWNNLEAGLNSKAAWDRYNLDGTGIKIAVLDTGINYTMENLDDNYLGGYDFVYDDDDPMPVLDQTEDHGTMVASLAVGEGVNKVVGAAYNASYYSIRITSNDASGPLAGDVISAIEWASTEPHKADIISMSFGTYGGGLWEEIWRAQTRDACNAAYEAGIVLVAASGNDGRNYSWWPARFDSVISAGGYAEDQTLYTNSNGGVDIITPADHVYTVGADNHAWQAWGTSYAAPHVAALIALQLQYARERGIEVNNAYLWEVMKASAVDLGHDPVYQGEGKIWAAETNDPPPDPHLGSIDLMGSSIWPFEFTFDYYDYLYLLDGLYPAYFLGTTMSQDITIENISNRPDIEPVYIENLNITTIQKYREAENPLLNGEPLPGDSTEDFETHEPIALNPGDIATLPDDYDLPLSASPGLYNVVLGLEFNLAGNPRVIKITDNEASIWCPPGPPPSTQSGYGLTR